MSSITYIHQLYLNQPLTPVEQLEKVIEKVGYWNPKLNAMVVDAFDNARLMAQSLGQPTEAQLESKPLLGVPCSIKECFAWEGMPQTSGLLSRKGITAQSNAPVVQRVLDAGAIPIGSTNLSELCMWMESYNKVYGRSNNPYDLGRTVGGSSGGEAALVGSGCVPFGLGSDIGGSIRMPAFFCGVFGHKPTPGLVPNDGQYPSAYGEANEYLCTGPIASHAKDLFTVLKVIAAQPKLRSPETVDISQLKVLNVTGDGRRSLSKDLRLVQDKVAQALSDAGAKVEDKVIPEFRYSVEIWSAALEEAGGDTFRELLFEGKDKSVLLELLRFVFGSSNFTFPALGLVLIEDLGKYTNQLQPYIEMGIKLRQAFHRLLGEDTLLLYPSHAMVAPKHKKPLLPPWNWAYTAILNVMKIPVTQVPLGLNSSGLPLGVQVGAGPNCDHLTLAVAMELENRFGGWHPPSLFV